MVLDKSCGNCRFSQQWGASLRCRRFPPFATDRNGRAEFQQVHFADLCGEFKSTPPQNFDFHSTEQPEP